MDTKGQGVPSHELPVPQINYDLLNNFVLVTIAN
jgi:hypothetical protein